MGWLSGASNKPPVGAGGLAATLVEPVIRRACNRARWCLEMDVESWSLVSMRVSRVSSSGGGLLECMYP